MRWLAARLASLKVRLFLVCWIVFGLFWATNVVREHYPAFALIERGDWVCDRYEGMHWDLFRYEDGHVYTGNNLLGSLIAVPPLLVFDPLLDRLEAHSQKKLAEDPRPETHYDTKYPLRREMFRKVKLAGLELRFGASTAITSLFLMAPLSAAAAVLVLHVLLARGIGRGRATWLAFLFAFATPVAYRTAHLSHNLFLMEALLLAFVLLWVRPGMAPRLPAARRAWAGFLCGCAIALDYSGLVPAGVLALYFVVERARTGGLATALKEAVPSVLAAVPPVLFLLGTQWAMYGDPFMPGQFAMPQQNPLVGRGMRGMGLPSAEVFLKNLLSPSYGLVPFAPLLLLAFAPVRRVPEGSRVLPMRERAWAWVFIVSFLLFCAANWYSLLQFNTAFRYLLPVVPFLFLLAGDRLARMRKGWLAALTVAACAHSAVLCMTREVNDTERELREAAAGLGVPEWEAPDFWRRTLTETPVPMSWRRVLAEGPQLPWLTVLRQTSPGKEWLGSPWLALGLMAACGALAGAIWRTGARAEALGVSA